MLPTIVFGIPTVARESESYLRRTMMSLKANLAALEKKECLFIILVAEVNERKALMIVKRINQTYISEIESGLVEVMVVNKDYYPSVSTYSKTKETAPRVFWRTKQNLDMIYLMAHCQYRAKYYVQLEDDVVTRVSTH
jgi:alpha-1,3-mannosylglycoprotein beta-1,4-N-acetylglucosaminyltransferase A/B